MDNQVFQPPLYFQSALDKTKTLAKLVFEKNPSVSRQFFNVPHEIETIRAQCEILSKLERIDRNGLNNALENLKDFVNGSYILGDVKFPSLSQAREELFEAIMTIEGHLAISRDILDNETYLKNEFEVFSKQISVLFRNTARFMHDYHEFYQSRFQKIKY